MLEDCRRRYGDMFTLRIAHEGTWVFLADPDAIKQVFTGDPRVLHAGEANVVVLPLLGHHSVLLLDEAAHMSQRKLMLPPFHGERMRGYEQTMAEVAAEEIESWPAGQPYAVRPAMQRITLEVIIRTVFGVQDDARRARLRAALANALEWGSDPRRMAMLATLGPAADRALDLFRRVRAPADELIYDEIRARRGAADLEERDDVLSLLLQARHEDGSAMSDEELRDELMTLLVAGHETTASSLAWAVERLVRNPRVLERLRDEVAAGDDEYVDAVCKETLRLRPILALVLRRLTEPMEIGGRLLPAGVEPGALHLPGPPPRRRLPRAVRLPARALHRAARRHLHLDPVRRRRAPLPRRQLRPVRDAGGAARAGPPARAARRRPAAGAGHPPRDHAGARARRRGRGRAGAPAGAARRPPRDDAQGAPGPHARRG